MSRITRSYDAESHATVFSVAGQVQAEELLNQIVAFLTSEPTQRVLWDVSKGSIAGISRDDLRTVVSSGARFAASRMGGKTAILCASEVDFGLARMFQAFAELEQVPFEIRVFRDRQAAREWLATPDQARFSNAAD